jgi:hypothetical protein
MTINQPLSLFISSKMQELADERRAVQMALKAYHIFGWLWEDNAGARPEPIRSTYLSEVEACDIYIGLFWLGYGPYTIEEYQQAQTRHKLCLVYEKQVATEQRSPELTAFLQDLERVENPAGITIRRFQTAEELARYVQEDVMRLLTTVFRKNRQQPAPPIWNVPIAAIRSSPDAKACLKQCIRDCQPPKRQPSHNHKQSVAWAVSARRR